MLYAFIVMLLLLKTGIPVLLHSGLANKGTYYSLVLMGASLIVSALQGIGKCPRTAKHNPRKGGRLPPFLVWGVVRVNAMPSCPQGTYRNA